VSRWTGNENEWRAEGCKNLESNMSQIKACSIFWKAANAWESINGLLSSRGLLCHVNDEDMSYNRKTTSTSHPWFLTDYSRESWCSWEAECVYHRSLHLSEDEKTDKARGGWVVVWPVSTPQNVEWRGCTGAWCCSKLTSLQPLLAVAAEAMQRLLLSSGWTNCPAPTKRAHKPFPMTSYCSRSGPCSHVLRVVQTRRDTAESLWRTRRLGG
jgi:hypothetical protein